MLSLFKFTKMWTWSPVHRHFFHVLWEFAGFACKLPAYVLCLFSCRTVAFCSFFWSILYIEGINSECHMVCKFLFIFPVCQMSWVSHTFPIDVSMSVFSSSKSRWKYLIDEAVASTTPTQKGYVPDGLWVGRVKLWRLNTQVPKLAWAFGFSHMGV